MAGGMGMAVSAGRIVCEIAIGVSGGKHLF